tara:strand:- start:1732 stop:2193 length:462 start_codon:yes stop_codon:yes gene_type:complete
MNKKQLTELVIVPTLHEIPKGYSPEAVMAIQMIIAHESSGGEYLAQTKGPALGIIQMEPFTHNQVWKFGDSIQKNAELLKIVTPGLGVKNVPSPNRLIYDLRYCVFMARQKLFMAPGAFPKDSGDMSRYLKVHWNGNGKATATKYHYDYVKWV